MGHQKTWSEWWRQLLGLSPDANREVLEILQDRYAEEMRHVKLFSRHAAKMQYPQFRERLLAIAADEAGHAECLAEKIKLFGGDLPSVPEAPGNGKNSWQHLLDAIDENTRCSAKLTAMIQTVSDELPDIAQVLQRIFEDSQKHREEIRDMLMRSDPQAHQTN